MVWRGKHRDIRPNVAPDWPEKLGLRHCITLRGSSDLFGFRPVVGGAQKSGLNRVCDVAIERYMAATASPSRRPILMGLAAGTLFILALLAKPHALAVAPMLAVYELLLGRRPLRNAFLRLAPFVIISAAYFLISMKLRIDLARPFLGAAESRRQSGDGPILLQYVLHTVLPFKLALYYYAADLPVMSPQGWGCWFGVALIAAATLAISRRRKLVGAGWLLALAGLFPASTWCRSTPAADHNLRWALPALPYWY